MTTMWVVWVDQSYAGPGNIFPAEAVFTSKEKAEAYVAASSHADEYQIEEAPVDPGREVIR